MAASGEAETLSEVIRGQLLQCKICLDELREAKTLPCLHTFCAECIHYYIEHSRVDRHKFACPICRRHVYIPQDGASGFPDSFFVASLTDIVDGAEDIVDSPASCGICRYGDAGAVSAAVTCVECQTALCASCATAHQAAGITTTHTLLPAAGGATCADHPGEPLRYYCETCARAVCVPCTFLGHAGHAVGGLGAAQEGAASELAALTQHATDRLLQLEAARDQLTQLDTELDMRREAARTTVRRHALRLAQATLQRERQLLADVDAFFDAAPLGRDRQRVQRTVTQLEGALGAAQSLLAADTLQQLEGRAATCSQLAEALDYALPDVGVHAGRLGRYVHFLPAAIAAPLGCLLQSSDDDGGSHSISRFRPRLPSCRAVCLHRLPLPSGAVVTALTFLPASAGLVVLLADKDPRVHLYDPHGHLARVFGSADDLPRPCDVAITHAGDVAVVDSERAAVVTYDVYGARDMTFGDASTLGVPVALTVDRLGRMLVCDEVQRRVTVHSGRGELLAAFSVAEVRAPRLMCLADNKLYVADTHNSVVGIYVYSDDDLQPEFLAKMSRPPGGVGEGGGEGGAAGEMTRLTGGVREGGAAGLGAVLEDGAEAEGEAEREGAAEEGGGEMFLDCSGLCSDRRGGLIVSDAVLSRLHVYTSGGETSRLLPAGQTLLRPTHVAMSSDQVLAVTTRRTAVSLDTDTDNGDGGGNDVSLYRVIKVDT